ncbi:hypothetical protein HK101_009095 [Irineochytrium annulatum]|nr:hypothetical protein HK101_009095 [Irineochytrium annulatum]
MEAQLVRPVAKQKGTKKKKKQATAVPVEEDDHVAAEVVKPPPTQHSGEEARASEDVNDFALVDEVPTYEDVSYLPLGTNVDGVLSSLVPEASAPSFYPTIDTRSRQEDMVDGGWEFNAFNVYPVQTPVLVEPSAPPMEHRMTDVSAPTLEQLGVEEEIVIEPLEDEVLAGLHVNLELDSHRQIVEEFRGNAAHFPTNDLFFDRLREYDEAYANSQRASLMLKSLQSSANNLGLRVWTLKKTSGSAEDRCADGVRLAHSYISEIGSLNNFDLSELEATFTKMRKEQHSRYKTAVFKSKLIKLWIQNFIDEFLGQMMDPQMEGKSSQFLAIREDDYDLLKHYIDVLFFFERRKRTSVDVEVPLPNGEAEEVNYSPFIRDVRGWTTHLMSALLRVARLLDHRFILLHVLRCEGIGAWGPSFVQWQIPQHWSDDYLNHYLTIVYAFFSPVEEVQEALQQKEVELYELKESLKKLQNLDWIVVDEGDVDIDKGERATIITEDDYLALLDQFNVLPVYGSFLQHCISKASGEQMSRDELSSALLKIFAVTSHLLTSLSRGLDLFTSNKHPRMIKRVAQLVGDMSKACADFLITNLNPWGHDLLEGSFEIPIVASPRVTTTVQAELDACFFRALKVLFTNSRKHVWPFLSSLRFDFVSHRMKWRFIGNMITGHTFSAKGIRNPTFTLNDLLAQFSDVSDGASNILTLLQGNAAESIHLLTFLTNIATCDRTIELSTPSDKFQSPQTQTARATGSFEIAVVVSRIIFFVSFLSVDYRDVLYKPARELLASICQMYPSTISFLLLWVRERFSDVSSMAIYLFSDLPLSQWRPRTNDLGVVQSMLKDPASSPKFQLARFIIGQLNWGYMGLTGSEELFLPRSQHRFIALAIANICLDRQSVRESRSVIGSTTAFASSAIAKVGSMALPTSMSRLYTDYDKEFYEWCWTIILSLQLYQRPTSHNTYTLETVVNGEKPFEPLDSPSLATLRGAMRSSSLAAYLILMMSELGHDFYLFEKDGWALLTVILDGQRSEAVIGVVGEVIIAFARSHGERLLESPNFTKFFTAFYRSRIPLTAMKWAGTEESAFANGVTQDRTDQNDPDGVFRNQLLLGISDDVVLSEGGLDIPGIVWLRTIFGDRDWTSNRLSMRFVDLICEVGLLWGFYGAVREEFTREYKRIWAAYATNQQSASRISLMNPVESVYSLALTMSDMYNGHPTLVLGSPTYVNWATPGFWGKAVTEKDYTYFAYEALLVETDMETELRQTIGNHLSKDSMIQLSQVSKEISKPLSAFTVYKWAFQILDTSPQHPVMPLMWQVFFALYFERASNPITTANACFGFRFFLDKKELLEKLFQRLIRDVVDVASVVLEPEVRRLYNAMTLWIRDSRLTSGGVYIEHLNEQYCLPKLRDTLIGSVLSSPDGRWLDLVQTSQLRSKIRAKLNRFDIPVTSPRGSVLKSPVGDRSAKMLSSSLPAVNYTVRQPLITPLHRFTIAQAIEIFRSDAAMIRDKGLRFQQIVEQNAVCDAEYISTLKGLYLNEQKRGRIEKRCSSACKGPAVINYRYQDVKLVGEVKSSLKENRATAESLSGWDNMDPKVVIGALKLLRAIDWLCGDADNVEGKAIEVFYEMIEVFAEDVRAYPPASIILENVINMIGHNYIMSSPVEILKV